MNNNEILKFLNKIHISVWMLVALSIMSHSVLAASDIEKKIDTTMQKYKVAKDHYALGVYVGDAQSGQWLYKHNFEKLMMPASITKLCTASAVLDTFPVHHKFKTQILSSGKKEKSILKGSIYLKGAGDPSFVSENMWFLVNAFTRNQITEIQGDIIVDDSLFDEERFDSSREDVRVDRAYDAPVGAMSFNWNSVNIFVRPGHKRGELAIAFADPESEYIQLVNQVKTVGAKGKYDIEVSRASLVNGDKITVRGSIPEGSEEKVVYKNITQPQYWSGNQLKSFLKQRGVIVKGSIKVGKTPSDALLLAESESKSLAEILKDMNKFSNNYVAEMLTKSMAATRSQPATMNTGIEMIRTHLKKIGLSESDFHIVNPSGLTRENRMNVKSMMQILLNLKNDFTKYPDFLVSLPIAGFDGTLKNRMKGTAGESWVRAKTGLLTGVVSLAGYAGRKDGSTLTFVFMFNGGEDGAYVRSFFDQLVVNLVE